MAQSALFSPVRLGQHDLQHKIVLAPLTRMRGKGYEPSPSLMAEYYAQRSSPGGLVITEGTLISPQAGAPDTIPGMWNLTQARYWKTITDAIRGKGAISCCQIWHRGRGAGAKEWEYEGKKYRPIGPSAIPLDEGKKPPTEMSIADIDTAVAEYANSVRVAIQQAGFDVVELHDANGYLLDQFLQSMSNQRTDDYGGSIEKRFTLTMRVLEAVTKAVGQEKVGVRFSPFSEFQGMREKDPLNTFVPLIKNVLKHFPRLAYIHLVEPRINGAADRKNVSDSESLAPIREIIEQHNRASDTPVQLVIAGGFTIESALRHSKEHPGDLLAFGRYFIANPDLPERIRNGWPLNQYDRSTFYTAGEKGEQISSILRTQVTLHLADRPNSALLEGYTDYPLYASRSSNL